MYEVQMRHIGELLAKWECESAEAAGEVVESVMALAGDATFRRFELTMALAGDATFWRFELTITPTGTSDKEDGEE